MAQNLSGLPDCAFNSTLNALLSTACNEDLTCLCDNSQSFDSLKSAVKAICNPIDDQSKC